MTIVRKTLALALAGGMTLAATAPTFAQNSRSRAAAGAGFIAGAIVGSTVANTGGYYYGPVYSYAPGYDAYASETYVYTGPAYPMRSEYGNYDSGYKSCATDGQYNRTDYSAC